MDNALSREDTAAILAGSHGTGHEVRDWDSESELVNDAPVAFTKSNAECMLFARASRAVSAGSRQLSAMNLRIEVWSITS